MGVRCFRGYAGSSHHANLFYSACTVSLTRFVMVFHNTGKAPFSSVGKAYPGAPPRLCTLRVPNPSRFEAQPLPSQGDFQFERDLGSSIQPQVAIAAVRESQPRILDISQNGSMHLICDVQNVLGTLSRGPLSMHHARLARLAHATSNKGPLIGGSAPSAYWMPWCN